MGYYITQWGQKRYREITKFGDMTGKVKGKSMPAQNDTIDGDKISMLPPQKMRNYHKSVSDHKDVTKLVMMLTSSVNSFRDQISQALLDYEKYNFLWESDRDSVRLLC